MVDEPLTRHPGQAPAWNGRDIDDVVAFLIRLPMRMRKGLLYKDQTKLRPVVTSRGFA